MLLFIEVTEGSIGTGACSQFMFLGFLKDVGMDALVSSLVKRKSETRQTPKCHLCTLPACDSGDEGGLCRGQWINASGMHACMHASGAGNWHSAALMFNSN